MNNKRKAVEWLIFLGAFSFGMTVVPLLLIPYLFSIFELGNFKVGTFYHPLLIPNKETLITWVVALTPYLLIQLVRSIYWSIKTVYFDSN